MKHLKLFEGFNPYDNEPLTRSEQIFGKQTRLEKQFSEIVVDGLSSDDVDVAHYWSTFDALVENITGDKLIDETTHKELQHRVVEGENPTEVMNDICSRINRPTSEIQRLLEKLNSF
jgi:hypothetical protein